MSGAVHTEEVTGSIPVSPTHRETPSDPHGQRGSRLSRAVKALLVGRRGARRTCPVPFPPKRSLVRSQYRPRTARPPLTSMDRGGLAFRGQGAVAEGRAPVPETVPNGSQTVMARPRQ